MGHVNAYFPLFVPESLLMRKAEHVEDFAPQVVIALPSGDQWGHSSAKGRSWRLWLPSGFAV